jgi:FtsP/CotA-like multicopper oxidase with cupredoxin domain
VDQQYHSFHIHQTPFLVTEVGGVSWHDDGLRDTFSVPPATDQGPGVLKAWRIDAPIQLGHVLVLVIEVVAFALSP